jgi:23S rRNA (uridine2552-2'-O)-methyltransferase
MTANRWDDHYTRRARKEKWLARSVYKLQEINKKFHLIGKGDRVLDLGCYPGSWSQYCLKTTAPQGNVIGIDLDPPEKIIRLSNFRFIQVDILDMEPAWLQSEIGQMNAVISDLAPKTTGIKSTDAARSITLAEKALEIALAVLCQKGNMLCKVLEGEDFKAFKDEVEKHFRHTKLFRPKATRKRSSEVYIIGESFSGH